MFVELEFPFVYGCKFIRNFLLFVFKHTRGHYKTLFPRTWPLLIHKIVIIFIKNILGESLQNFVCENLAIVHLQNYQIFKNTRNKSLENSFFENMVGVKLKNCSHLSL